MRSKPKQSTLNRIVKRFWSERPTWFKATLGWWLMPTIYLSVIVAKATFFVSIGWWRDSMKAASKWGRMR